jgi:hypothetical protein
MYMHFQGLQTQKKDVAKLTLASYVNRTLSSTTVVNLDSIATLNPTLDTS